MAKKKFEDMVDLDGPAGSTLFKNKGASSHSGPNKSKKRTEDIELPSPTSKSPPIGLGMRQADMTQGQKERLRANRPRETDIELKAKPEVDNIFNKKPLVKKKRTIGLS